MIDCGLSPLVYRIFAEVLFDTIFLHKYSNTSLQP